MIASAEVAMCRIKTSINQMANYIEILEIQDIGPQKITLSFKISTVANEFFQSLQLGTKYSFSPLLLPTFPILHSDIQF